MSRDRALWTGILAGPIVWLISFEALFALNPWACIFQTKLALYIVSIVAFALSLAAGLLAWRQWKELGREADPSARGAPSQERTDTLSRSRLMAFGGVILSALACLIIVAQAIPELILEACQ